MENDERRSRLELRPSPAARVVLAVIKAYQVLVSPLLGKNCRFAPTCSRYTYEAVATHGVFRGVSLGAKRLSRCHPWHEGGYDPIPSAEREAVR